MLRIRDIRLKQPRSGGKKVIWESFLNKAFTGKGAASYSLEDLDFLVKINGQQVC